MKPGSILPGRDVAPDNANRHKKTAAIILDGRLHGIFRANAIMYLKMLIRVGVAATLLSGCSALVDPPELPVFGTWSASLQPRLFCRNDSLQLSWAMAGADLCSASAPPSEVCPMVTVASSPAVFREHPFTSGQYHGAQWSAPVASPLQVVMTSSPASYLVRMNDGRLTIANNPPVTFTATPIAGATHEFVTFNGECTDSGPIWATRNYTMEDRSRRAQLRRICNLETLRSVYFVVLADGGVDVAESRLERRANLNGSDGNCIDISPGLSVADNLHISATAQFLPLEMPDCRNSSFRMPPAPIQARLEFECADGP